MSNKTNKLPAELDRRRKLTDIQKETIKSLVGEFSISAIAREFKVSNRTIQFIAYPERRKPQDWKKNYTKETGTARCKKTREYKQSLIKEGKL